MKEIGEIIPYVLFIILLSCYKFCTIDFNLYLFWQPVIDNIILLFLLLFMYSKSNNWYWLSQRLILGLIFILLLNTYSKLFGMSIIEYSKWYHEPILIMSIIGTIPFVYNIIVKLHKLWKDGKVKFF